ncbi:MAG: fumarylacetoacetase, partial [Pyrinomonadaceae bacterium]
MYEINETHDPNLKSWVESANDPNTDFPIQNLPFCSFKTASDSFPVVGVRIGNQILDLTAAYQDGVFEDINDGALDRPFAYLGGLARRTSVEIAQLRRTISSLLREGSNSREKTAEYLIPAVSVEMTAPTHIGDYTDFYCSIYHATNVGSMFR